MSDMRDVEMLCAGTYDGVCTLPQPYTQDCVCSECERLADVNHLNSNLVGLAMLAANMTGEPVVIEEVG